MKIGLISDIHSNFPALNAAISQLKKMKVDKIFHCGDLVGYYSQPNEVIDLIRKENIKGVLGNHDYLTLGGILLKQGKLKGEAEKEIKNIFSSATTNSNRDALNVIKYTVENLSEANKKYLISLDDEMLLSISGIKVYLTHGSPSWFGNTLADYIFEERAKELPFEKSMISKGINIIAFGHTHVPYLLTLDKWARYVVNCGSIGQPRDGIPFSSSVIVDVDDGVIIDIKIIRSMYNIMTTQVKAWENVLPIDTVKRLNFGE